MAYTVTNFKSKKELKEAVAAYNAGKKSEVTTLQYGVLCFQPGLGLDLSHYTGRVALEGPHYPKPHSWYAEAELVDGVVVKVK
jgi:hypothetical protein